MLLSTGVPIVVDYSKKNFCNVGAPTNPMDSLSLGSRGQRLFIRHMDFFHIWMPSIILSMQSR